MEQPETNFPQGGSMQSAHVRQLEEPARGRVEWALSSVSSVLNALAAYILLPILALLISADVAMRYLFSSPIEGAVEGSQYLLLGVFTFGMSYTTQAGHHIRMDLFYAGARPVVRMFVEFLSLICGTLFFSAIAYQSWRDIEYSRAVNELSSELSLPIWVFYALIMSVFGLICFQIVAGFLVRLVQKDGFSRNEHLELGAE